MFAEAREIHLDRPLTVQHVAHHQELLLSAMRQSGSLEIAIDRDQPADCLGVQLIESARRFAAENGHLVRLREPASGPLLDLLQQGGFLSGSAEAERFWLQNGNSQ